MALNAIVFDLDGTLIDTNPIHCRAWQRAFETFGFAVALDRIAPEIARDGHELVASILGRKIADELGDKLREAVKDEVLEVIEENKPLRVFPGARELLLELKSRGYKTAIATAASEKELAALIEGSGLDVRELCDAVTTTDDAEGGKPEPDILLAACEKLGLSPAQCAFVGDALWDAHAARRSGLCGIGVLAGSAFDETTLREAGMRLVFEDVSALLHDLDNALEKAAPGELILSRDVQQYLMRAALDAADEGVKDGGVPIGAVLARPDGAGNVTILARGYNESHRSQNPTDHAEIVAFRHAAGKIPEGAKDVILVSTLEPCVMCLGAAMEAGIDIVLYGLQAPADNGTRRVTAPQSPEAQMPRIIGKVLRDECRMRFEDWLTQSGDDSDSQKQALFVRQLLELTD
jgi:HAD superfamily hydrolase (TIGR01509 family)